MKNQILLTKEGYDKLTLELADFIKNKRPFAVERLRKARDMGDLSENSEYTAAKEDLAFTEGRIQELEEIIKRAHIVEKSTNKDCIDIGCKVTVAMDGKNEVFDIVGEIEADPMTRKLSSKSPIGKALLGKKCGELIEINIPNGKICYKIISIQ